MQMLKYKGYIGSIEASVEDGVLFGKLEFIQPLINYEGETVSELKTAFEEAVDDYLNDCESQSIEPAKPCKGSFNVRIGHDLHLSAMVTAKEQNISLNDFVKKQIERAVV
ncbi:MAG: type II toxin-antitoxin system HicB family antitoxin [Psychrosphaera sp.]|nr:type II toxin-antitoxin system HicB family antitoxin [Psychrosphaera sp.]